MEVVIDVNVLVSATLSGTGASAHLIEALRRGGLTAFASDKLITELGDPSGAVGAGSTCRSTRWRST